MMHDLVVGHGRGLAASPRAIPLGGFDPAARQLGPIKIDPTAPDPRPGWPAEARFSFGDRVQCTEGAPYRFPGTIVGWHRRHDGGLGYAVSREGDPGNVEIFGERRLEVRNEGPVEGACPQCHAPPGTDCKSWAEQRARP